MSVILDLTRIVQAAAEAESPSAQVSVIVDSIQHYMNLDVCSLYLADEHGDMALLASRGLDQAAVGHVRIPAGKGLVGLVAQSRHPINIADAARHPAFYGVRETQEEQYSSFFGVPIVRSGVVIGVLVAQSREARELSDDESAVLVTLGSQLALVVATESIWQDINKSSARTLSGIKGAPGVGIGQVRLCDDVDLYSATDGPCDDIDATLAEWHDLVNAVLADVKREQAGLGDLLSQDVATVFDAYYLMLSDPSLVNGVAQLIQDGHHLPGALKRVIHHHADVFLAMEDPYLRARHEDIRHLGNKLYSTWRGLHTADESELPTTRTILVGAQVSVSDIARVPTEFLAGIVCFQGSNLSHTAVLANALGVPAVMGVGEIRGLYNRDLLVVDGNTARVIVRPNASVLEEYQRFLKAEEQLKSELQQLRDLPAITQDGTTIRLYANSGLLADISPGLQAGAEGLGLYRTEIPFMVSDTFPSEDEQLAVYRQILQAYGDKPVYMRVLDIGGDKPLPYFPIREENPALGWRGIRFCLDNSSLFMSQIRAMLRAAEGRDNLRIMLPMVGSTSELVEFHKLLKDALLQLTDEGVNVQCPPVGIMVEVPSAISQLRSWREQLDFISIGSNDLSQYLLALDRNNPRVAASYDHVHPAVLHEIARVIEIATDTQLPVSVCGEMSSDPIAVVLLVGMGMRTLSMSAAQLPKIKWLLRRISLQSARAIVAEALQLNDAKQIRKLVADRLYVLGAGEILW
ncbi:MAG: phosphoenolpyruvate--protein phosphotransferase [Haliea sp.]|nr:phosphoenolpyruvate--protein phosphotransferase [Haliea sp.]